MQWPHMSFLSSVHRHLVFNAAHGVAYILHELDNGVTVADFDIHTGSLTPKQVGVGTGQGQHDSRSFFPHTSHTHTHTHTHTHARTPSY